MRVLRLIARLNVGGPAQHVVWLTEGLAREGCETLLVTGVVPPGEDDMSAFAAAHGVTPHVIASMSRELSPRDAVTIWKLWRLMIRFRPDVVHTHTAKAGAVGRIAGLLYRITTLRRCRFVHTYHGHVFHGYYGRWKTRFFLFIERMLARLNTDRLIVLSEQQLREIHETFRVGRREQFAIVPLCVGPAILPARTRRIAGPTPKVGIIGRLAPIKNHELFLRVAAGARDLARFVIYGDGAERARLEQRAVELNAPVAFAGTRPSAEIYQSVDVVALTSRNEGTPLVLLEAMAYGLPVISTDVGGVADILGSIEEHDDSFDIRERGITVASGDTDGFIAALRRLLSDDALRQRLVARGRPYIERAHSRERLVADILRVYRTDSI